MARLVPLCLCGVCVSNWWVGGGEGEGEFGALPVAPLACTRPPWRSMIWRTLASLMQVPGNWLVVCSRWNGPKFLAAWTGSNPARLSRIWKQVRVSPAGAAASAIDALCCPEVNFQASASRFCRKIRGRQVNVAS